MSKIVIYCFTIILITGCDKWYTTDDISHISYIPQFTVNGGDFISVLRSDTAEYIDQGATATANEVNLQVYVSGEVDLSETGIYFISYAAQNSDGIVGRADRIVAVTHNDVSSRDLSGVYVGMDTLEMNVRKIHEKGLYECDDILGNPEVKIPGKFVDLGNFELMLLPGESDFGRYAAGEGGYTRSSLSWTIEFLDPPNAGSEYDVIWRRKEE